MVTIETRVSGRRADVLPRWQLPVDTFIAEGASPLTLREFIETVVRSEVDAFRHRQNERRLARFLTAKEIGRQATQGRVDFGGRDLDQVVDVELSVGTALQSFEDGTYFVLIDGQQQRSLDDQVFVGPDSRVTFLRLVPLAGG